jgi:hypothetical protein
MENITGIRGDEHDQEGITAGSGQRGCERPGGFGGHTLWSNRLN